MKYSPHAGRFRAPGRLILAALLTIGGCALLPRAPRHEPPLPAPGPAAPSPLLPSTPPPEIAREFRGVWVATVNNMDWPSRPGLSVERQQAELLRILDRAAALGLNAVLFQVRPAADALYASPHEPWSHYLTGTMGKAPEPFYDPLEFAVAEAHRRGLELHAWFNPFRARMAGARGEISRDHVVRARPELVRRYGAHLWMDPSEPAVQDHAVRVILDVVRRYDIDGVHIDDYFYPYREYDAKGALIQFPDAENYARYRAAGGVLGRSDWRRDNVNRFVERLYGEVKRERAQVKLGISPFGIWRPGYPAQIRGLDAYEEIFADARRWLRQGWLDYFTPQLYWPVSQHAQSFPVLLNWWVEQNDHGRHIWPGGFSGRVGTGPRSWPASEILSQIEVTREHPGATGNVHFSMKSLLQSPDSLAERLSGQAYTQPALVPASPWLKQTAPARPQIEVRARTSGRLLLSLTPDGEEEVFLWAVRARERGEWTTRLEPGWKRELPVPGTPEEIVVTAVGRTGNEGPAAVVVP